MTAVSGVKQFRMTERKPPDSETGSQPKPKSDSAFDLWLQRGLHKLYDDVANEPVPDALLRLIEEDRKK